MQSPMSDGLFNTGHPRVCPSSLFFFAAPL